MQRPLFLNSLLFLIVVSLSWLPPTVHAGVITNGSFETGNFSGWTVSDIAAPHIPLTVRSNGYNSGFGFFSSTATNGNFSATHGFDGGGPGTIRIFQDIGAVDTLTNLLSFDYRAGWDMLNYGPSTADRTFNLNVYQQGSFNSLATNEILRAVKATATFDTGALSASINLSSFVGQNVRISFDAVIPQNFTGPGFLQLDNIRLGAAPTPPPATVPEPTSLSIFGLAIVAAFFRNRRIKRWQLR